MKRSTVVSLILSIVFIVLGGLLVYLSYSTAYSAVEYTIGFTTIRSSSYGYGFQSLILATFGKMSFTLGLVGLIVFAILAVKNPKEKVETKAEKTKETESAIEENSVQSEVQQREEVNSIEENQQINL